MIKYLIFMFMLWCLPVNGNAFNVLPVAKIILENIPKVCTILNCNSEKSDARKLMGNANYVEARVLWLKVINSNSNDAEALEAIAKCEEEILNQKIVQVRDLRMAGNFDASLESLGDVFILAKKWNREIDHNSANFLSSEAKQLQPFFDKKIKSILDKGFPLKALVEFKNIGSAFEGNNKEDLALLEEKIYASGKSTCKNISKTDKHLMFYKSFTHKFCDYFNSIDRTIASVSNEEVKDLYSKLEYSIQVKGAGEDTNELLKSIMEEALKSTPWFNPNGEKVGHVKIKGDFFTKIESNPVSKTYIYFEKIPYTEYQSVQKIKKVPYTSTQLECKKEFKNRTSCRNNLITKYRNEFYTTHEPVTKYRSEAKSYAYKATEIAHHLKVSIQTMLSLEDTEKKASFSKQTLSRDYEHQVYASDIGLYPHKAQLKDPIIWLREQAEEMKNKFSDELNTLWEDKFCKFKGHKISMAYSGEQIFRCAKLGKEEYKEKINKWHETYLGISITDTKNLLGDY